MATTRESSWYRSCCSYGLPLCVRKRNGEVVALGEAGRYSRRNSSRTGTGSLVSAVRFTWYSLIRQRTGANFQFVAAEVQVPVTRLRILVEIVL